MKIHRTYNKDEISQSYTVIGVKGKMLPTGSFLAYHECGQDYFAINSLVESLNNKFGQDQSGIIEWYRQLLSFLKAWIQ